ncbi:neuroendocrine convertase 1-like [Daktulosphaira vitifoliae]|uniref:neuroendocrine convertase 1-like n=1 Tax=Daktulosphaira vitifoliae TaxID=58002 RepID=UPI0021A9BCFE|nr:neuroendocrine convertase 1-like [Daktulosphaira vitifoliae]
MDFKRQFILFEIIFYYLICDCFASHQYTNKWIVHVPFGEESAKLIAQEFEMEYIGPVTKKDHIFAFVKQNGHANTPEKNEEITNSLKEHSDISWALQEHFKTRDTRSLFKSSKPRRTLQRQSSYRNAFNDEYWEDLWYLQDYRTDSSQPVRDMNVVPVFFELNITGAGVNITVPDDGLQYDHPDIAPQFNPDLSWNYITDSSDILPRVDKDGIIRAHGTKCAGEIIMQPNNNICGVGIAYGASLGGVKFLDNTLTDIREGSVLQHALKWVDIYSNSWGPSDSGDYLEHLSDYSKISLSKGIHQGRNGKGAIYVFAAGNGKMEEDNCGADGYVNSIYTIIVASCDDKGRVAHYSERCPSVMVTAYSGAGNSKNIVTTDVRGGCTTKHTGTSAAAPLISGIIALALSANPSLTWRDVQHLIVWTSQVAPLANNLGWTRNQAGFYYSNDFGFGLANAYQLVKQAQNWKNVPKMASCAVRMPTIKSLVLERYKSARIIVYVDGCRDMPGEINYLEQVQLVLTVTYPKRGDIQVAIRSPQGTTSQLLEKRGKDRNVQGLRKWTLTTLAFWGESPKGYFYIDVFDKSGVSTNKGRIKEINLALHGTKEAPSHYSNGYRSYDAFELLKSNDESRFVNAKKKIE